MKKRLFLSMLCAAGISSAAYAAGGDMALGVQLSNASAMNQMGLGVRFQCELVDAFRLEPSFDYYFKHNSCSTWEINLNLHYMIGVTSKFDVYPLAGLGYAHWSHDVGDGLSRNLDRLALNLGGGGEVAVTNKVAFTGELRYQIMSDYSQFVPMVGVKLKF